MAQTPPFAPWVYYKSSSSTSLSRLGLEVSLPPRQVVPASPAANHYLSKELPPLPTSDDHKVLRSLSDQMAGILDPRGKNAVRSQHNSRVDAASRPPIGFNNHSLPGSVSRLGDISPRKPFAISSLPKRPLPLPPMTTSARKVLELTGFDPSSDCPSQSHYSISPDYSDSSSQYSQPESEPHDYAAIAVQPFEYPPMTSTRGEPTSVFPKLSPYELREDFEKSPNVSQVSIAAVAATTTSTSSLRTRDRLRNVVQREILDLTKEDSKEDMINEESMILEEARYERQKRARSYDDFKHDRRRLGTTDAERKYMTPKPLALRTKVEESVHEQNEKLERHYTTTTSPTGMPYDGMAVGTNMHPPPVPLQRSPVKRDLGISSYPLENPFPSAVKSKTSDTRGQEHKPRKKFSLKRFSGGKKSTIKQTIIPNAQREPSDPDTPTPSISGFPDLLQKGAGHLQDAVDKAKKGLKIKIADEKKREELKKQIVVIGITDQSPGKHYSPELRLGIDGFPDGMVSEWF